MRGGIVNRWDIWNKEHGDLEKTATPPWKKIF